jgi:ABC-type molybdate transport system ATPase subunit
MHVYVAGELEPDGGRAYVNGYDVVSEKEQVRQELGFCPQFDPLLDLMTAREHLTMYGRVRGIPEAILTPLVQHLIDKLGLKPFADNITETYSGGNKRKCSLALALIGNPSVVFLYVNQRHKPCILVYIHVYSHCTLETHIPCYLMYIALCCAVYVCYGTVCLSVMSLQLVWIQSLVVLCGM